ncbi:hypothetical protein BGZ63DRAFT_149579 [Mariannaea sp. PMI_226]|nr:hypothetical protein BGZ63DRAFT_149579 [Mariannaea sp. PMI_226]
MSVFLGGYLYFGSVFCYCPFTVSSRTLHPSLQAMNHGNYAPMPIIWGMGAVWDTGQVINPPIIAEIKVPPEQLHPEARNLYEHSAELSVLTEDGRPFLGSTCEVLEYTHSALAEKPSFQTNLSVNMGDRISFFFGPPAVGSWLRFTKEARCRKYQLRCDFKISVKDGGFWVPRTIIGSSISPVVEIQNHDKPWRIVHLPSDQVQGESPSRYGNPTKFAHARTHTCIHTYIHTYIPRCRTIFAY